MYAEYTQYLSLSLSLAFSRIHARCRVATHPLTPDKHAKSCGAEYGAPAWVGQPCDHAPAAAAGAGTAPTHRNVIAAHVHAEAKGATGHSKGDFEGHSSHERGRAVEPLIARAADGNSGRARADAGVGREDGADARTTYVSAVNPATPHDAGVSMGEATQAKEALPVSLPATARSPRLAASRPLAMPRNGDGPQDGTLEWTRTREEERLVEKDMDDGTRGLRWRGAAVGVEECMEERDALVPLEGGRLQASAPAPPVTSLLRGTPLTLVCVCVCVCVCVSRCACVCVSRCEGVCWWREETWIACGCHVHECSMLADGFPVLQMLVAANLDTYIDHMYIDR
jgi:hypothetical protein